MLMSVLVVGLFAGLAVAFFKVGARTLLHATSVDDPPLPPARVGRPPRLPGPPPLRAVQVVFGLAVLLLAGWCALAVLFLLVILPSGYVVAIAGITTGVVLARLRRARRWTALERLAYASQTRHSR